MIHTEGTETTNFTKWNREEISYHIISAIGDDWLSEAVHDALILKLEDLDAVTPDEFWTIVEATFAAEAEGELDTDEDDAVPTDETIRINFSRRGATRMLAALHEAVGLLHDAGNSAPDDEIAAITGHMNELRDLVSEIVDKGAEPWGHAWNSAE